MTSHQTSHRVTRTFHVSRFEQKIKPVGDEPWVWHHDIGWLFNITLNLVPVLFHTYITENRGNIYGHVKKHVKAEVNWTKPSRNWGPCVRRTEAPSWQYYTGTCYDVE